MRKDYLLFIIFLFLPILFSQTTSATHASCGPNYNYAPPCNANCKGVLIPGDSPRCFDCGAHDGLCPQDYGASCGTPESNNCDPDCTGPDNDGDGYHGYALGCVISDCNDNNANINPGVAEICNNNVDDNCNSRTDCAEASCAGLIGPGGVVCCQNDNWCNTDNWYCNVNIRENRNYYCSNYACTYSILSSEDCSTKPSTDSDNSATAYTEQGYVSDYTTCLGGSCSADFYNDACSTDLLTEYGTSGVSYIFGTKNCNDYDTGNCWCSTTGSTLSQICDDWNCNFGRCQNSGSDLTQNSWSCTSSLECNTQSCSGTSYKCYRTNAGSWTWATSAETYETNCNDDYDNDCDGSIDILDNNCPNTLVLTPNPVAPSGTVTASLAETYSTGTVIIKDYLGCSNPSAETKCSFTYPTSSCTFTAPSNSGYTYGYYACIGQKSDSETLTVSGSHCAQVSLHYDGDTFNPSRYSHSYTTSWDSKDCDIYDTFRCEDQCNTATGDIDNICDDYNCNNDACADSGSDWTRTTQAQDCIDTCSGATSASYQTSDADLIDNEICTSTAQESCPSTTLHDSCNGNTLTEYYCSGTDSISSTQDCNAYDGLTCNAALSRNEYRDYGCSDPVTSGAYCSYTVTQTITTETNCNDGIDNDCNQGTDCADPDCAGQTGPTGTICCQTAANCLADGWYCNVNTKENRDYSCTSNACTYSASQQEDCLAKPSTDSDNSATAYTVFGTVVDYTGCFGGSCTSSSYQDSCAESTLTEYSALSTSFTSSSFNCDTYDTNSCWCSATGSSLDRKCDDYNCGSGKCQDSGTDNTQSSQSCSASNQCGSSSGLCAGYKCHRTNAGSWTWATSAEATETNCNDGYDNDCDTYVDAADSNCALTLILTPNPVAPSGTVTASLAETYSTGTITIKDYLGCTSPNPSICSFTYPTTSCAFTAPSNSAYTYGYYACIGQNSDSETLIVTGSHCSTSSTHSEGDDSSPSRYSHSYTTSWGSKDCDIYDTFRCGDQCNTATGDIDNICDDYNCNNDACADSGSDWTRTTKAQDCSDTCSGETSASYQTSDADLIDNEICTSTAQESCPSTTLHDSCNGNTLTEYYCSGADAVSSTQDCNAYDSFVTGWYCNAALSRNEYRDYGCSDPVTSGAYCSYTVTSTMTTETNCNDGIDNDCNQGTDCADPDCAGQLGPGSVTCCQTASNCQQDDCKIESCTTNTCQYTNRLQCDTTECAAGTYCNSAGGDCKTPDENENVCINCVTDQTSGYTWNWATLIFQDAGKGYSTNINSLNSLFNSDGGSCSVTSGGACFDAAGASVNHKSPLTTGNCCGNDVNEFYKPDYYGGECTNNLNDCVWSTGDVQASNSGNAGWWCYLGKWEDCLDASDIGKKHGGATCVGTGTGWVPTNPTNPDGPGGTILPENQYSCTDGLDNDGDGAIDCQDTDCYGSITGTVTNENSQAVSSANVDVKLDLTTIASATTSQAGTYSTGSVRCGNLIIIAAHPDYVPQTKSVALQPNQQAVVDFNLVSGTSCEQDCTYMNDNIIHASCAGKNGCSFYDDIAKAACDNAQPGWVRDYDANNYVKCASGTPQPKVEIVASVTCSSGTLVKITRIAVYNGKPVKLVVATCG